MLWYILCYLSRFSLIMNSWLFPTDLICSQLLSSLFPLMLKWLQFDVYPFLHGFLNAFQNFSDTFLDTSERIITSGNKIFLTTFIFSATKHGMNLFPRRPLFLFRRIVLGTKCGHRGVCSVVLHVSGTMKVTTEDRLLTFFQMQTQTFFFKKKKEKRPQFMMNESKQLPFNQLQQKNIFKYLPLF